MVENKTLITYMSKSNATAENADIIAKVLRDHGLTVDIVNLRETKKPDVMPYDNIIVGSGIRIGMWYRQAKKVLKRKDITLEDVEAVRRLVPEALRVCPRIFSQQAVYSEGHRLPDTFFVGTGPEMPWMVGMELDDGRYFTPAEDLAARPVAVIGWDVKDELFPNVDPIGRMIKAGGRPFRLPRTGAVAGTSQASRWTSTIPTRGLTTSATLSSSPRAAPSTRM